MKVKEQMMCMNGYRKAEWLKHKHRFNRKLLWIAPLVTILLAYFMMGGSYLYQGAFNWWYILLLPGSMALLAAFMVDQEKRKNRHGMLAVVEKKSRLWRAQVEVGTLMLLIMCMLFWVFITVVGVCVKLPMQDIYDSISLGVSLIACIVIFLSVAWQIPLWMFVAEKVGVVITLFCSMVVNIGCQIVFAESDKWWIPFAIPARLMCAIIKVLPNGLQVEEGSYLLDESVIVPGIAITMLLWSVGTAITGKWFEKREVL